ncbi:MAG: helix-turn-helix domain-containing protein [Phycisphaerales bacterium]
MRVEDKILALLAARGLKQIDAAHAMGVDSSRLTEMKNYEWTPNIHHAFLIAKKLGVSLDYLLDESIDEPPPPAISEDERSCLDLMRTLKLPKQAVLDALKAAYDKLAATRPTGEGQRVEVEVHSPQPHDPKRTRLRG